VEIKGTGEADLLKELSRMINTSYDYHLEIGADFLHPPKQI
jgi:hypothetical protein